VPAIAEVEKRRSELEEEVLEKARYIRSLEEQLREARRGQAKVSVLQKGAEKRVRELEAEVRGKKERLESLRKVNARNG
jgi:predicted  nucleic acid-binding Zn-ribbon protein